MTREERSREVGRQAARLYYNDFVNHPEWRGATFSWDRSFPDMAARHGRTAGWMAVLDKEVVEVAAREEATKLVAEFKGAELAPIDFRTADDR